MTASESSPGEGHESGGASDLEQHVLRQIVRAQTERVGDELRFRRGDDLREELKEVRRARAELAVTERLLEQYVEEDEGEE